MEVILTVLKEHKGGEGGRVAVGVSDGSMNSGNQSQPTGSQFCKYIQWIS